MVYNSVFTHTLQNDQHSLAHGYTQHHMQLSLWMCAVKTCEMHSVNPKHPRRMNYSQHGRLVCCPSLTAIAGPDISLASSSHQQKLCIPEQHRPFPLPQVPGATLLVRTVSDNLVACIFLCLTLPLSVAVQAAKRWESLHFLESD